MSTLESLFVQIFDRKNWIEDQLKQQRDLYDQYLASTLLIRGIRPPSWLLGTGFEDAGSADLKELKKEELISGLLFPPPRPNIPGIGGHSYHYNRPITAANFGQISNALFTDTCASNKYVNMGEVSSLVPKCHLNYGEVDLECALQGASGQDNIINSPQSKREEKIVNVDFEPDQSLSRIQRSRSRQKALELRNSGKASSKKRQREEKCTDAYTGRITRSRNCVNETVKLLNLSNCSRETACRLSPVSLNGNGGLLYAPDSLEIVQDFREGLENLECTSIVSNLQAKFNCSADGKLLEKDQIQAYEVKPATGELGWLNDVSPEKSDRQDVYISPMPEGSKLYAQPVMEGAPESCEDIFSSKHTRDDKNIQQEPIEPLEEAVRSDDRHEKCDLSIEVDLQEKYEANEDASEEDNHAQCDSSVENGQLLEIINNEEKSKHNHGCYEADELDDVPTDKLKLDICSSSTGEHDYKSVEWKPIESLVSTFDDVNEECGLCVDGEVLDIDHNAKALVEEKLLRDLNETQEEIGSMTHIHSDLHTEKSASSFTPSSKNGISEIYGDLMSNAYQQSNALQKIILPDSLSAGQFSARSPSASQLHVSMHGLDANSEEGSIVEKCGMLPMPEDSKCNTDLSVCPRESVSHDIDDGGGLSQLQKPEMSLGFHKSESSAASTRFPSASQLHVSMHGVNANSEEGSFVDKCGMLPMPEDSKSNTELCVCPRDSSSHGIYDAGGLFQLQKPEMSLRFHKSESSAVSATGSAKVFDSNLSRDSPYFLRSYSNHSANVKLNGSCCEVENLMNIEKCAFENSWPAYKRRKIGSRSSGLFTSSPRPKQVNLYKQSLPVLDFHQFSICNTEVSKSNDKVQKTLSEILQSPKDEQCMEGEDLEANKFLGVEKIDVRLSLHSSQCFLDNNVGVTDHDELIPNLKGRITLEGQKNCSSPECTENVERTEQSCSMKETGHERNSNSGELVSYCSVGSPQNGDVVSVGGEQYLPEFEGFSIGASADSVIPDIAGDEISWDKLDLPVNTSERISFLEKLCRSATILTPSNSANYKLHNAFNLNRSLPNEHIDFRDSVVFSNEEIMQLKASYNFIDAEISHSAHRHGTSSSNVKFDSDVRKPSCTPPVSKFSQKITSYSSGPSSEKQQSLNPELTCFRIDEDTDANEDDGSKYKVFDPLRKEDDLEQKINSSIKRPLVDVTNKFNHSLPVSVTQKINDRGSVESINTELDSNVAPVETEQNLRNGYRKGRRSNDKGKENHHSSLGVNGLDKTTDVLDNKFRSKASGKFSNKKGNPSFLDKGHKHNNIVSNVSSFISFVQQKNQPAAVYTGKRDVKVKALEAAEAAKRLEEKRENDRKLKKEAAKLERARLEQEKVKQMELQQKKKEEERKKKEAEIAARKRLREEEEKREKERKRRCIEEARRQQKEQEEKLRAEKEREQQRRIAAEKESKKKQQQIEEKNHQRREQGNEQSDFRQKLRSYAESSSIAAGVTRKQHELSEGFATLRESHDQLSNDLCEAKSVALIAEASERQSYELSPYKDSDEEEEEEDELPNNKFVPTWARGKHLALELPFTQRREPTEIFTPARNCSIVEFFSHK